MKYRIRNNSTGEERVVSEAELAQYGLGRTTSPLTTTAPEPEEARIGPLLGNLLRQTRTAQYAKKLPEIYGGITEDIQEKGLGHYLTPQGYLEQLQKTGEIYKETLPEQIGVAGEIAPFLMAGGALPKKFGPRVLAGAKRGGLLAGIHGVTGVSLAEKEAKEEGRPVPVGQAGLERLLMGGVEAAGGAAAGGIIAGLTAIPGLIKKSPGKLPKPRAGLAEAKRQAFQNLPGKPKLKVIQDAGNKFAERTPQVKALNDKYQEVLTKGFDWVELGESVSDWGSFGHAKDSALKGTPTGRYFAKIYQAGRKLIEDEAPEAAKLITIEALTYQVPRLVNRWTWQLLKFRGLGRLFGV